MGSENGLHNIVTRPYNSGRFLDGDNNPISNRGLKEIDVKKVASSEEFCSLSFLENKNTTPSLLTDNLYHLYDEKFGKLDSHPDIFFHLVQQQSLEPLAPRVQIFTSDVILGNLNKVGFYRIVINGQQMNHFNSKRYIGEILRLYHRDVIDIKGVYSGYLVDLNQNKTTL